MTFSYCMVATVAKTARMLAVIGAALISTSAMSANFEQHPAKVLVNQTDLASGVRYHYTVVNESPTAAVTTFTVGFDYYHRTPELTVEPTAIVSPPGWEGKPVFTEETLQFEIEWSSTGAAHDVPPGGEMRGFAVVVPQADAAYRQGHFTTIFGNSMVSSKRIVDNPTPEPVDSTPPQITVALTPDMIWPPNNKLVDVAATVNVQDDQDPNPVVRLESIQCLDCASLADDVSEAAIGTDDRTFAVRATRLGERKEGRVYKAVYSATDAAGNTATAEATVQVPHDQRRRVVDPQ